MSEEQEILNIANLLADKFAGHSFRIGADITAATMAVKDSTICSTLGWWKSLAYLLDIR